MTFIVTFVALLIERFFDWSHIRLFGAYQSYQHWFNQRLPTLSPYLILTLVILPILLVVGLLQYFLQNVLYGFAVLIFELLVLLYCFGPRNLWADTFACINAIGHGDADFTAEMLKTTFNVKKRPFLSDIFIEANRRVFAVLLWFVILGPVGAVLYRCVSLSAANNSSLANPATLIREILDWLPIRLLTLFFALGGHFSRVLAIWQKKLFFRLDNNEAVLVECGTAALGLYDEESVSKDGAVLKNAIHLLDRALVIFLVIVAIFVLL